MAKDKDEGPNVTYTVYVNSKTREKFDDLTKRVFLGNKSGLWRSLIENLADAPEVVVQGITGSLTKETAEVGVEAICEYFHKRYGVPHRKK